MTTRVTGWRKSSHSHFEENACIEIGTGPGIVGIRDSKQSTVLSHVQPELHFPAAAFTAFLRHVAACV